MFYMHRWDELQSIMMGVALFSDSFVQLNFRCGNYMGVNFIAKALTEFLKIL